MVLGTTFTRSLRQERLRLRSLDLLMFLLSAVVVVDRSTVAAQVQAVIYMRLPYGCLLELKL
jgi:hypothetical protein